MQPVSHSPKAWVGQCRFWTCFSVGKLDSFPRVGGPRGPSVERPQRLQEMGLRKGGMEGLAVMRNGHLRPEEPDVAALQETMAEAEERAHQQDRPECSCLVQVLCYAKLLHIV